MWSKNGYPFGYPADFSQIKAHAAGFAFCFKKGISWINVSKCK